MNPAVPGDSADAIVAGTLEHYAQRADAFWEGTRDHDVSQNIDAMLAAIEGEPPYTILDFGCGPGRDLKTLTGLGHRAIGLDALERFASMARDHSGCEVLQQDFLHLDLPPERFDGVFANAALFHVPSGELPRVLCELHASLKPRGVLFSSNPHGDDQEGWSRGRYGAYHRLETWRHYVTRAGFAELAHYYRPEGLAREQQPWLATVWRKAAAPAGD
ncbi:MAG: methyltransferase domain-containing protein [Pseudomonadota bacterium]|nr:methyltransferase domain-containing protein [Pseudomonadota bacterium]